MNEHKTDVTGELLDTREVAAMLRCSPRTVRRLADAGAMPPPVKLGGLVRWPRKVVVEWIESGCPRARTPRVR
jgi:prophage regulatory protein